MFRNQNIDDSKETGKNIEQHLTSEDMNLTSLNGTFDRG